jgi:hypothetical protein
MVVMSGGRIRGVQEWRKQILIAFSEKGSFMSWPTPWQLIWTELVHPAADVVYPSLMSYGPDNEMLGETFAVVFEYRGGNSSSAPFQFNLVNVTVGVASTGEDAEVAPVLVDDGDTRAASAPSAPSTAAEASTESMEWDVVVYGATPGGVVAAVAAARLGRRTLLLEPSSHVGGMLAAGMVDDSNKGQPAAYGGLAAEYYRRVGHSYGNGSSPYYKGEPHVMERTFRAWVNETAGVTLMTDCALIRVESNSSDIVALETTKGFFGGVVFVDATYEGDVMGLSGVPFAVGRESSSRWNESLAGAGLCSSDTRNPAHYQRFHEQVSAYSSANDSALLPGVALWQAGRDAGANDSKIQSFNFRACLTHNKANGVPIERPDNYSNATYFLLQRMIQSAGSSARSWTHSQFFSCGGYTAGKCSTNDGSQGVSINPMGHETYDWPTANFSTRQKLLQVFRQYTLGLWYYLGHEESVPQSIRSDMQGLMLCKDEWPDNGHLPHIPHVREGRRMQSDNIFTQEDYTSKVGRTGQPPSLSGLTGDRTLSKLSVGRGYWFIDVHAVQRVAVAPNSSVVSASGSAAPPPLVLRNEGCVQIGRSRMDQGAIFPIPYGVMVPPPGSARNLLVAGAVSSSHIGYQAFRVEPTFMVLGQAAGTAAALAVANTSASGRGCTRCVDGGVLQARLRAGGQVI